MIKRLESYPITLRFEEEERFEKEIISRYQPEVKRKMVPVEPGTITYPKRYPLKISIPNNIEEVKEDDFTNIDTLNFQEWCINEDIKNK